MTVLDTDVLIGHLRRQKEAATALAAVEEGKYSSVSRFELYRGIAGRPEELAQVAGVDRFLRKFEEAPLDPRVCLYAARVYESLRREGLDIGVVDSVVAGTALAHRETLLSRNEKHFKRVKGLRWRSW
jgi:predicted nucleic acid-binding protein